jgi:hypothetical protein
MRRAAVTLGAAGMLAGGVLVGPASAAPTTPTAATVGAFTPAQPRDWYQRGYQYGYRDARDCKHDYPPNARRHPSEWWRGYRNGWQRAYYRYCR